MSKHDKNRYVKHREEHVRNFLMAYGPCTKDYLRQAIPGNLGGDALLVAKRLMDRGRIPRDRITDLEQMEF